MINPRIARDGERATNLSGRTLVRAALALTLAFQFTSCASNDDMKPRRHTSDRKWYQGEMDTEDRTFFIDSFFNGRG